MEGFTIKCNKCGKEQRLITKEFFDCENIKVYPDRPHYTDFYPSINIDCECGNEAYETYT